jgi:hypothetical protein
MQRFYHYLLTLFCLIFLMGCKLTVETVSAPDTADSGSVIPLTVSCTATNMSDGSYVNGVVVQIPAGWTVLNGKVEAGGFNANLAENSEIANLYKAEAGHVIWAGTINSNRGEEGSNVSFTIKVLTGNYGNTGQIQVFNLKAVVGAKRAGAWITDDPESVLDFAAVTEAKFQKSITVTQIDDTTAPEPISNLVVGRIFPDNPLDVQVTWYGYDEDAQGDVVAFRVYRSTNDFSDVSGMSPIAEVNAGTDFYFDQSVLFDNGYYYAVTAIDEIGQENHSVSTSYIYTYVPGSIRGTLYETGGTTRITGKNISVKAYTGSCDNLVWAGETNVDSSTADYTITVLMPGTYSLQASSGDNYITEWWASSQSERNCESAQPIEINEGQIVTGADFHLDQGAIISGTVYESNSSTLLTGKNIWIYAYTGSPCGELFQAGFGFVDSATGTYSISGLTPGTYYLQAMVSENYISEWWASPTSSWSCSGAQGIAVTGTENIVGKDFQLTLSDSIQKGDINGDGSVNLADLILTLQLLTGKNIEVMPGTDVDQNGKTGMEEAIYILQIVGGIRP